MKEGGFEAAQQTEGGMTKHKHIPMSQERLAGVETGGLHIRNSCRDSRVRPIRLTGIVE